MSSRTQKACTEIIKAESSEERCANFSYTWEIEDVQYVKSHETSFTMSLDNVSLKCEHQLKTYPLFWKFSSVVSNQSSQDVRVRLRYSLLKKNKRVELTFDHRFRDIASLTFCSFSEHVNKYDIWDIPKDLGKSLTILVNVELLTGEKTEHFNELLHRSRVSYDLQSLFESKCCSDVKIIVLNKEILAHRALLACRSPVFFSMFQHEMKEKRSLVVEIVGFGYDVVLEMLRFLYMGTLGDIDEITGLELLRAADQYIIEDLKILCEDILCQRLTNSNAVDFLIVANRYNAALLKKRTMRFIVKNSRSIVKTQAFKTISNEADLLTEVCEALAIK